MGEALKQTDSGVKAARCFGARASGGQALWYAKTPASQNSTNRRQTPPQSAVVRPRAAGWRSFRLHENLPAASI